MEKIEYKGMFISLDQDIDAESPADFECPENGVFLVTTRNRYFEVIPKGYSVESIAEHMKTHRTYHGFYVWPLFAYIHSGVALSLGRKYPFNCPWDSGQIGFILVKRGTSKDLETNAQGLVDTWNQYLSGDVWSYCIKDNDDNFIDACSGFYGQDWAIKEAKDIIDNYKPPVDYCI